jgi:outer membrane lipoprotein-sorting protein
MKRKMLGIITVLVLIVASMVACSKASTTNQLSATTSPTTAAAKSTATSATTQSSKSTTISNAVTSSTSQSAGGSSLSDLVVKASKVAYYYCQVNVNNGTQTENLTEWFKTGNPAKFRMEVTAAGQTEDIIFDGQNYYMYTQATNTAIVMSAAMAQQYASDASSTSSLTQYNPVIVGTETLNGMACTIYQYTNQGVSTKVWIWNQYGLPVQIVTGTTTVTYSNFSFSSIDDSMFQLPSGVTTMAVPGS